MASDTRSVLLVTGGRQGQPAGVATRSHRSLYDLAGIARLDPRAPDAPAPWLGWSGPGYGVDPRALGHRFGGACLAPDGRTLVACTEREIVEVRCEAGSDARVVSVRSHRWLADVHAVAASADGGFVAAATGVDGVVFVGADGGARFAPVGGGVAPPAGDVRAVALPRARFHPNAVFAVDGGWWVTRGRAGDAVRVGPDGIEGAPWPIADVVIHDGVPTDAGVWFTAVDGRLLLVDPGTGRVARAVDLRQPDDDDEPLGWCRGLAIDDGVAYVGFSRLRATRARSNLAWLRGRLRGRPIATRRPTRIAAFELSSGRRIGSWPTAAAGLDAVFGVVVAPRGG